MYIVKFLNESTIIALCINKNLDLILEEIQDKILIESDFKL